MKQKNKFTISKKIFIITFGLIFVVLIFSMLFQNIFFEDFYLSKRTKDLANDSVQFTKLYAYENNDIILNKELFRFEQETNSKIAIFTFDGKLKVLNNYNTSSEDIKTLAAFCEELINDDKLVNEVLTSGKPQAKIFNNEYSNTTKIGVLTPMSLNSKNDSIFVTVSSMQPISEASSVIREFYLYLFLGFTIIGIFLSSIYANLISKPLVNINKVAKRMSAMDFSVKCDEESNDEIGDLATTLNFLSSTLKNTLEDLKYKNRKLEEDIEKERNLEAMRKDFVDSVSHDLKTPIGIIEGYAEGLKDGIATGESASLYLDTIIDEAKKMNKLVSNMLELSKLEAGISNLLIERFNILRLIQKLIKSFTLEFEANNITLDLISDFEYCYIIGDTLQLEQVMTNLISNALKYTPKGEKVIIEVLDKGEFVNISVENKGANIPDEELSKLYNKFYKLDKARNSSQSSNGLGLAIVKRILTLHESNYRLYNTKDGVKFEFTLKKANENEIE